MRRILTNRLSSRWRSLTLAGALAAGGLLYHVPTAIAEMTPWAQNEGGRMRIIALPPEPNGKVRGALQIEPKAGWITYWREPGDAGIPPKMVFSKAGGVTLDSISYPVPKRIDSGKLRDIGYDQAVTFPFELTVSDPETPVSLGASAFIGLCRNICIPFQAEFTLALGSAKGTPVEEAMILTQAALTLPEAPSDDFSVTHYAVTQSRDLLKLTLELPADVEKAPQVFVTGPEGHVLFDSLNGERKGNSYSLDMPIGKLPEDYEMKGQRWGILVIAGNRAMETSLAFE